MRTMGDTPAEETAPTCKYMALSSMSPCSQSINTHYLSISVEDKVIVRQTAHTSAPKGATVRANE